jgi:hypothetical protein
MVDRNTTNSVPLDVAVINYTKSTTKTKKVNSIDLTFAHDVEDHICLINWYIAETNLTRLIEFGGINLTNFYH